MNSGSSCYTEPFISLLCGVALVIYIHGKGGSAEEAKHYQPPFPESDVIGFDYQSENPWDAKDEFSAFYDLHSEGYGSVVLIANSIGAFF